VPLDAVVKWNADVKCVLSGRRSLA